jgi:hypothetical protein
MRNLKKRHCEVMDLIACNFASDCEVMKQRLTAQFSYCFEKKTIVTVPMSMGVWLKIAKTGL